VLNALIIVWNSNWSNSHMKKGFKDNYRYIVLEILFMIDSFFVADN